MTEVAAEGVLSGESSEHGFEGKDRETWDAVLGLDRHGLLEVIEALRLLR